MEIAPHAAQWWEDEVFPSHVFKAMGELGLMGVLVPERYGGADAGAVAYVRGDGADRRCGSVRGGGMERPHHDRQLAAARLLALRSRSSAGFARSLKVASRSLRPDGTRSGIRRRRHPHPGRRDGDDWIIDGTKMFISNAGTDMSLGVTILAVTGDNADGSKRYEQSLRTRWTRPVTSRVNGSRRSVGRARHAGIGVREVPGAWRPPRRREGHGSSANSWKC